MEKEFDQRECDQYFEDKRDREYDYVVGEESDEDEDELEEE